MKSSQEQAREEPRAEPQKRLPHFRHATCGGVIAERATSFLTAVVCQGCGAAGEIRPATDNEGEPFLELVDRGSYLEAMATFALFDGEPDPRA